MRDVFPFTLPLNLRPGVSYLAAFVAATLLGLSSVATAQTGETAPATRAEAAAAARRASRPQAEPAVARVDQIFNWVEESRLATRIFDPPEGWFATVGGMAEGNGFTAGGGYRVPLGMGAVSARAVGSYRRSYLVDVTWRQNMTVSGRVFAEANVGARNEAQLRFSGLGPDPVLEESETFALDATFADGGVGVRLTPRTTLGAGVGVLAPNVELNFGPPGGLNDGDLSFADHFAESTAPGLTLQPTFLVTRAGFLHDRRDAWNARAGSVYALDLRRFADRDTGASSFMSTRIELQQFVPFWNRTRVLALRVVAEQLRADEGAVVPFYLRPTIGGSRTLRGYERQRFRDNGVLLLQAEYRYEINTFLMGAVFADAGQAAPSLRRMQWRDLRTDYGVGLRFGYTTGVALRTDVAFGGDRTARLVFTFSGSF